MKKLIPAALCALCVTAAFADFDINLDLTTKPLKDMRTGCNSGIGFNAALEGVWSVPNDGNDDYWFVSNKVEAAAVLKQAGANILRLQCFNSWFARRNQKTKSGYPASNPKAAFDIYKANGIKVFVCLEIMGDTTVDENVEIIQWLVDNGYKDCVAGIELGNETYGSPKYPSLAPKWTEFVNRAWKIWPNIPVGINIGELFENNPDIVHMRNRIMSNEDMKRDWAHAGAYFSADNFNRYSYQFVTGMSNCLDKISHIIYHAYGAETPYSCSYYGFQRFRNFQEICPAIKGKKYWLTEIRPRSDEDNNCQRMFREALIMGHYTLMALCQPETDGFCHHQLTGLSGALHMSDGRSWYIQWYDGSQNQIEDVLAPYNRPHMEASHIGVMYRILGQGIKSHPLFIQHGTSKETGTEDTYFTSARVTDEVYRHRRALKEWKEAPKVKGEVEWVAAVSPDKNSLCLLMVNSKQTAEKVTVKVAGKQFAAPTYRTINCPEKFLDCRAVPGEGKFWTQVSWEDTQNGYAFPDMEMYKGMQPVADTLHVEIAPNTVQTVTVLMRNAPKK